MSSTATQRLDREELACRAMGSDAHLIVVGGPAGLLDQARHRVDELERRWSRFIESSEISRLNRMAGTFVEVSPDTITLVERAKEAWRLSGGAFDPTVLGAVIHAGYDRSFDLLGTPGREVRGGPPVCEPGVAGAFPGGPPESRPPLGVGVSDILIDGGSVQLPPGTGFDPGGIGKGLAADLVCDDVMSGGAEGACINLGGDVRVSGTGPGGEAWTVDVEHPDVTEPIARLGLAGGAVATSTTLRRRWMLGGTPRHHLIDPQTGLPSETDLTHATVIAAEAWVAEVLAKAVLLAGSAHPFDIVGGTGAEALVVDRDGRVQATPGVVDFLGAARLPARIA